MNLKRLQFLVLLVIFLLLFLLFYNKKDDLKNLNSNFESNKMKISFLDIGQGDSILIDFIDGSQMLVDCAEDARVLEALGRNMDYYDKTIEYLVISHPHSDHYGGCEEVLNRFKIGKIIYNGLEVESNESWQSFLNNARDKKIDLIQIDKNDVWQIASSTLYFLYPDTDLNDLEENKNLNNSSIVFQLVYGENAVLFTGDIELEIENYLLENYSSKLKSQILKSAHHGSDSSSGNEFLDNVLATDVIISVGEKNSHGHPSRRILKRFERAKLNIWRTDLLGDIILEIGENGYEIRTPQVE